MRRFLHLFALVLAVSALVTAAAWAHSSGVANVRQERASSSVPAPFHDVPAREPGRDASQSAHVYGYRSAQQLGDAVRAAVPHGHNQHRFAAGVATIQVTAVVLPSITVSLDHDGHVSKLTSNTGDRVTSDVLFVFPRALDARTWNETRVALEHAHAGFGTIWVA